MKLDLVGYRIVNHEMRNNMTPNMKINLQVSMVHQITVPKQFGPKSVGTVRVRVMVGNPLQPLYILMEQINNFSNVDQDMDEVLDQDEAMSLFKTICVPLAIEKVEENLNEFCKIYKIPEFKLNKNPAK